MESLNHPPALTYTPVARMRSEFPAKFGIPRQSGLVPALRGSVVFEPPFRDEAAVRGLEEFSHLWLLWHFSQVADQGWNPTVRPPRLGGNARVGVFATRSPFRPNPLGLSLVGLEGIELSKTLGPVLHVSGGDLMDGTPILDVKPYLPYTDCRAGASAGFTGRVEWPSLTVDFPSPLLERVPQERREALWGVLTQDPRPSYQDDPLRVYGLSFAGLEVRFSVAEGRLTVLTVEEGRGL